MPSWRNWLYARGLGPRPERGTGSNPVEGTAISQFPRGFEGERGRSDRGRSVAETLKSLGFKAQSAFGGRAVKFFSGALSFSYRTQ